MRVAGQDGSRSFSPGDLGERCVLERSKGRGRDTAQRKTQRGNRHTEKRELTGETQGKEGERDGQVGSKRRLLVKVD